ncbi:DUF6017 domain-containing protein [Caproiciproducens galactitolivorans]|uniref:DUF6017 domain-containing protein n=1 Tax=Caproiciproducens galactitolivorans TaxID=642589 RepID=UPI002409C220|nr:DUF6017 domain-containing protein [Caproiciproducens galactitolivorans]
MGEQRFDYHYGNEAEQYSFYRIPKILIVDDRFKGLSTDAKLLYGLMLDRMSLSVKSGWFDEENRVFIHFALNDIMEQLNCQHGKAVKLLAELDDTKGIGLIRRVKQGQGRPAKIYVMKAATPAQPRLPNNGNQDFSKPELQTAENRKSRLPKTGSADFPKSERNNTERNNTDLSDTDRSIHPALGASDSMDVDELRQTVKENIDYDILLQDHRYERDRLDEIVDLIVETLCSTKPTICVSGDDFPAALVKEKLLKLDSQHIEYVFECLDKNTTYVRNIKKYLLATLFNAPSTIDSYYSALVNHDLYGDGSRGR